MTVDVTSLFNRRADSRWDRCSVGDIFERVAFTTPAAEALVAAPGACGSDEFSRLTYAQADRLANSIAHALRGAGLDRGARVLMICENSVEALLAKIGAAKIGAVVVPVNPAQTPDVLQHAVSLTRPGIVIADAEHGDLPERIGLRVDVTIPIGMASGAQGARFDTFIANQSAVAPEATVHGDDIWQILFTSGTTALPKGVMLSHQHAYLTAMSYALSYTRGLPHESQLRLACFAPVAFHVGDQAYAMPAFFTAGTTIVGRRYRPAEIARTIAAERATAVIGGGIQLCEKLIDAMVERGPDDMRTLRFLQFGLGVLPLRDRERLERLCPGVTLLSIAGQTESVSAHRFAATVFDAKYRQVLDEGTNLVGRATPLMASRVVDLADGASSAPDGTVGELVYRSPVMTAGYYRDRDATEAAFEGGWFHSGDLGVADADGDRYIVGRLKDVIKTGGENVTGARVEAIMCQHPDIAEAAVIGLPDPIWGEAVTAVVVLKKGVALDEGGVMAFCRARLAGFETPKRLIVVPALPRDFIGKVRKFALREMLCKDGLVATAPG